MRVLSGVDVITDLATVEATWRRVASESVVKELQKAPVQCIRPPALAVAAARKVLAALPDGPPFLVRVDFLPVRGPDEASCVHWMVSEIEV